MPIEILNNIAEKQFKWHWNEKLPIGQREKKAGRIQTQDLLAQSRVLHCCATITALLALVFLQHNLQSLSKLSRRTILQSW